MQESGRSPKLVPYGADQTIYLVVDSFSASGAFSRETEVERTNFETIIVDFLTGQFNDPVRVVAFNTLEHWSDDVSEAIATEIQTRCDIEGVSVPEHARDFVDRYRGSGSPTHAEARLRLGIQRAKLPAGGTKAEASSPTALRPQPLQAE
jgi:hypothetical protein